MLQGPEVRVASTKLPVFVLPLLWSRSLQRTGQVMYKEEAGPGHSCTDFIPLHSSPHPPADPTRTGAQALGPHA